MEVRIIKGGGGRKAKLLINDQIILTLVYLRHLPTFGVRVIKMLILNIFALLFASANSFNCWDSGGGDAFVLAGDGRESGGFMAVATPDPFVQWRDVGGN